MKKYIIPQHRKDVSKQQSDAEQQIGTNRKVKLKLSSLHGTIRHYYHFFFGVFVPLLHKYIEYSKKYDNVTFIINDDLGLSEPHKNFC